MHAMRTVSIVFAVILPLLSFAACSSEEVATEDPCLKEPVAPFNELMIIDEAVLRDPRAANASAGPWSFRYMIENMTPAGVDAGEFVRTWLENWVAVKQVNGISTVSELEASETPGKGRDHEMQAVVICPWLKRTTENACNDDCTSCTTKRLDLAKAPFRLIAIANRLDLRDEVADAPNGEGRLLFGLTQGAADDPASSTLAMSVIFEYTLPESKTPKEWAATWHALGAFASHDEPYRAALESVTNSFVRRGSRPAARNGSAIGQVRTNESRLFWVWQQREFGLEDDGMLRLRPVRNTPAAAINNSQALRSFVLANLEKIKSKKYEMPINMRAGAADEIIWQVPDVDANVRKAFAETTCNGCHSRPEHPNVDTAFHVSPLRIGLEKLSPFVYDPNGGADELTLRTKHLRRTLCGG